MVNYKDTSNNQTFQNWMFGINEVLRDFNDFIQKKHLMLTEVNWRGVTMQHEFTICFRYDSPHKNYNWVLVGIELIINNEMYELGNLISKAYPGHTFNSIRLDSLQRDLIRRNSIRLNSIDNEFISRPYGLLESYLFELFDPIIEKHK